MQPVGAASPALERDGEALATRDAERREPERGIAFTHLVGEGEEDAGAAHPDRMPERDAPALDVQLVAVELQLALAGDDLRGERLVDLDQIEVGKRQARSLEELFG